jgi:hypothetical protein
MNVIDSSLFDYEQLESLKCETSKSYATGPDIVSNNFPMQNTLLPTRRGRDHDQEKTSMFHFTTRTGGTD